MAAVYGEALSASMTTLARRIIVLLIAVLLTAFVGCVGVMLVDARRGFHKVDLGQRLQGAALKGDIAEAEHLLDQGADPNYLDMYTPLEAAIQHDNIAMAELLIKRGADVNYRSYNNWTPLRLALEYKNAGMITLLRRYGAKK